MADRKRDLWFAIDAGATNAVACVIPWPGEYRCFSPGDPDHDVLVGDEADWLVPCACLHLGDGRVVVGRAARIRQAVSRFTQHVMRDLRLHARYGRDKSEMIHSNGRTFTQARAYGEILKGLKKSAVKSFSRQPELLPPDVEYFGEITRAVITTSACFGPRERAFMLQAAQETAGFSEVRLIDSPLAAALGLGLHKREEAKTVLVLDLGGGTCDLMALRIGRDVPGGVIELGRIGSRRFGGLDIDAMIARDAIRRGPLNRYDWDHDQALRFGPIAPRLLAQAEQVKLDLCRKTSESDATAEINWVEPSQGHTFQTTYTSAWLKEATKDMVDHIIQLGDRLLDGIDPDEAAVSARRQGQSGISWRKLDEVHLVGGGSAMPPLEEQLLAQLGGEWNRIKLKIAERPQRVVAEGAAVYAEMLSRGQVLPGLRKTRCPADIGIRGVDGDDSWLGGMKTWLQSNQTKKRKYVFHPMVECNSMITDGQTATFVIPVLESGSAGKIDVDIFERFVKQPSVSGEDEAEKKKKKPTGLEFSNRRLAKIKFRNLPAATAGERDEITLLLRFTENRTVEFTAAYRRKTLTSRLFGGNFDHVFDFSGAAGE